MCKPKECGGLGLRDASLVNKAFMAKLGWRLTLECGGVDHMPIVKV